MFGKGLDQIQVGLDEGGMPEHGRSFFIAGLVAESTAFVQRKVWNLGEHPVGLSTAINLNGCRKSAFGHLFEHFIEQGKIILALLRFHVGPECSRLPTL